MDCEICGRADAPFLAIIEGAKMQVCSSCAYMGKIITYPKVQQKADPLATPKITRKEFDLVESFGTVMRNARMKSRLPLSVLAERLNEKESFLERVEHGSTRPSESLAHKLEKELGVKLLEEVEAAQGGKYDLKGKKDVTLGDILDFQKKKKKE